MLSKEELKKLPTKRLLAYKKKYNKRLYRAPHSANWWEPCDNPDCIECCEYKERQKHLQDINDTCAGREHVE